MWIDSHCHLNHENIRPLGSVSEIISRAKDGQVDGMLTINCRVSDEFSEVLEIAQDHSNVWCTVGTHPHDAADVDEMAVTCDDLVGYVRDNEDVVGMGETGLDYFYENSPMAEQQESFRKHLRASVEAGVPVIVHTRDADVDTINILREESSGGKLTGVLHCFSSTAVLAQQALDLGFYISFSGIVTFNKADELREIVKAVPLDRILVETDAPYLAPKPFRGKVNEPSLVVHTGELVAGLHDISAQKMAQISTENFFRLFSKAKMV